MEVAIYVPEDIAQRVQSQWGDMARHALEGFALEGFRARVLSTEDVRRLLGLGDKFAVHAFFKAHDLAWYDLPDLEHDRETSARLGL